MRLLPTLVGVIALLGLTRASDQKTFSVENVVAEESFRSFLRVGSSAQSEPKADHPNNQRKQNPDHNHRKLASFSDSICLIVENRDWQRIPRH